MKKKSLLVTILLLLIAVFAFSLTACNNEVGTLESLQNEYGIVVDGGSFEEGSTLVSNEIVATTEEAAEVLAAIADQNYNKDGSVYIFDIYVTKDGKEVQPNGKVKVSVPVPNVQVDNYLVFHVKDDNSVEKLVPTVADGKISFETSSFSYFVIAEAVIQDAPPIHVHNFEWVEGKESTCKEEGIVPHYHCDGCGKNFDQNYGEIDSVITEKGSHDVGLNYAERIEPTFFMEGTVAYYICNDCLQYIDEDGQIIPPTDIIIPPLSLDISVCVNGVPTELALQGDFNGVTAEWKAEGLSVKIGDVITVCLTDDTSYKLTFTCDGIVDENGVVTAACEVATVDFYADHSRLHLVMLDPTICEHNYVWVEGKEPTCEEEGVVGHFHCEACGKNFDPNYGEIDSIVIGKLPHDVGLNYSPRVEPTFFEEGTVAYYICNDCLQFISEDGQIIPPTDISIPTLPLDISVCVNGVPTELALQGDFNGVTAEWKADGLSVKIGDVITVCLTDDTSYKLTFTCDGIVDENGVVTAACEVATVDFYADHSRLHLVMIDPTVCEHNYVWVEGKEPTCEEEGVADHYHCDGCGKNFDPNYGEMESISIPKAEHEYGSMYWGNSANFFEDGNIEYYQCSECEKYFDNEYNEVETPVIPKYSTNISICVNGVPTALVFAEQYEGHIIWTLDKLTVKEGDVITVCCTDSPDICHSFSSFGIVDPNGKITMTAVAQVVAEATYNGLMLSINYIYEETYNHYVNHIGVKSYDMTLDESNPTMVFVKDVTLPAGSEVKIHALLLPTMQDLSYIGATLVNTDQSIAVKQDGYFEILGDGTYDFYFDFVKNELTIVQKDKGIVIEINGVQYPMNYVTYSDEQTTGYIYGLVNFAEDDKFVVVDKVNNIIYDYDDLCATFNWNTWDFHRGDNGEFVIDNAGRYGIEFDGDITKEIYINKHFAPLDGGSYEVVIEGNQQGVSMQQTKIPEGSEAYDGVLWYHKHESVMNVDDILTYIEENGLYTYTASVTLAAGSKLNIKNLSVNTVITADHLTEVYANDVCLTKEGDYVKFLSDGVYFITYLPAYNAFSIHKSEEELPDAYIYCDVGFVALTKDANNVVSYEGLVAEANNYITFFDGTKTKYLSITLDSNTDSTIAHVMTSEGLDMLFFDKAGTYNLAYNIDTGVLSITSVGGDNDQGGGTGGDPSVTYSYVLSVVDSTNGNKGKILTVDSANQNEYSYKGIVIAANSYITVTAGGSDGSNTTYYTLSDTDASVATTISTLIMLKKSGTFDIYFNTQTKTVRVVYVGEADTATALPKDVYISTMEKYAFIENPDNSDELCYLGLVLESYDEFRIRDTDNNYISDITLASGTTGANTSGSSVMVVADGTYNIYINKTTHEVRIVAVS